MNEGKKGSYSPVSELASSKNTCLSVTRGEIYTPDVD